MRSDNESDAGSEEGASMKQHVEKHLRRAVDRIRGRGPSEAPTAEAIDRVTADLKVMKAENASLTAASG